MSAVHELNVFINERWLPEVRYPSGTNSQKCYIPKNNYYIVCTNTKGCSSVFSSVINANLTAKWTNWLLCHGIMHNSRPCKSSHQSILLSRKESDVILIPCLTFNMTRYCFKSGDFVIFLVWKEYNSNSRSCE